MLRRRPLGEADEILALLSPEQGRFDAVARGSRKPTSRWVSVVEPFTRFQGQFARGRSLDYLSEARRVRGPVRLRGDLECLLWASYLVELFLNCLEAEQGGRAFYALLCSGLEGLEAELPPHLVARWVECHLLRLLGLWADLDSCCQCASQEVVAFWPEAGGGVCRSCGQGRGRALLPEARAALGRLSRCSLRAAGQLRLNPMASTQVEQALRAQFAHHFPQNMRALKVLKGLVQDREPA